MFSLLKHRWIEKRRSMFSVENLLVNIFSAYLLLNVLVLGFLIDRILISEFPNANIVLKFTEFSLYYFLMDLMIRFLLQKSPTIVMQPYLLLPIRRSKLFHYPILISLFNVFNLIPYILILPFFFRAVLPNESISFALTWIISLLAIAYINNYIGINLKRFFQSKPLLVIGIMLGIISLVYADNASKLMVSEWFGVLIMFITSHQFLIFIPLSALGLVYYWSYRAIKGVAYLEELLPRSNLTGTGSSRFEFLQNRGQVGQLMLLELKMIWRNKRPKYFVFLSLFLVVLGFNFYTNPVVMNSDFFLLFVGMFMTNMFMMQYGQFLFAWESSFFDHFLAYPIDIIEYLKAKYWLVFSSAIMSFTITSPFAFFDIRILFVNFSCLLFNLGVTYATMIYLATYNKKRIDISKSAFMNYEGIGGIQFLTGLILLVGPFVIFLPFSLLGISNIGLLFIGGIGVIGILMKDHVIILLAKQLQKRKYIMSHGFRKV